MNQLAGVPCGQVSYRSDLYADPQVRALGMIWELQNRDLGPYKASGNPIRFQKTPLAPAGGAPALGEHSAQVLADAGFDAGEVERLKALGVLYY